MSPARPARGVFFCQTVNPEDEILGFVIGWIKALASKLETLEVIALEVRLLEKAGLPDNVTVHSLGKEQGAGRLSRALAARRVLARTATASQFMLCHMAPAYVLAAKPWFRAKPLTLWYTHQHVDAKLKAAVAACDLIFTAAEKTMNVASPKKRVMGHGIDPVFFETDPRPGGTKPLKAVSVGRLSPRKNLQAIIEAARLLREQGRAGDWTFELIGAPATPDQAAYVEDLKRQITDSGLAGVVSLPGPATHARVAKILAGADAFISSQTRTGFDKAALEAMAAACPALVAHPAYLEILGRDRGALFFEDGRPELLAAQLTALAEAQPSRRLALGQKLKARVKADHSLDRLMERILDEIAALAKGNGV